MFTYEGRLYMVFGDTFGGPAATPFFSVAHSDWRSNTMAYVASSAQPVHGLYFSGMVTGGTGTAEQLLSSKKVVGVEQTVIPTYGIAVGKTMYLSYMSVKEFGAGGHWSCNYSGVADSKDGGQLFVKAPHIAWAGDSNFGQVAWSSKLPISMFSAYRVVATGAWRWPAYPKSTSLTKPPTSTGTATAGPWPSLAPL
jgi:hypothetical protein